MKVSSAPFAFLVAVVLASAPLTVAAALPSAPTAVKTADTAPPEGVTWGVEPVDTGSGPRESFEYSVDPGTQIDDIFVIINSGTVAADFRVYATDAVNDFETGGLGLLPADEAPDDLGSWITTDVSEIRLEPGTQARVPFTLLIPSDASPGDHAAGIIASSLTTGEQGGQAVVLDQRVGARVNLRVSGPIATDVDASGLVSTFSPSVNPFAPGTMTVDYAVANNGNVRLDVTQKIDIVGPFGIHLGEITPEPVENLLPGQSTHVTADVTGVGALALAWSDIVLTPGPVGSAAKPDAAAGETTEPAGESTEPAGEPAPAGDSEFVADPLAELDFTPASATSVSIAISWTLLALVVLFVAGALLVARYVTATRERMFDAIDEAAAEARDDARRADPAESATEREGVTAR